VEGVDKPITSDARKQSWAKSYTLVQWECCATHAVWRFLNQSGREIIVHLMMPKAHGISPALRASLATDTLHWAAWPRLY